MTTMTTPTTPTTRDPLQEALDWCEDRGLVFDYVNANAPHLIERYGSDPRKVAAHLYLDDRAGAHPFLAWYLIYFEERLRKLPPRAIIAVDFDGTLCEEAWPEIGAPNDPLIDALCKAQTQGHRLTLWTCREHPKEILQ